MRKEEEFRFLLSKIIETLPDSVRGAIKGSVYSIAAKKGTKEARRYHSCPQQLLVPPHFSLKVDQ